MVIEARQFKRFDIETSVVITDNSIGELPVLYTASNLSEGGLFIKSDLLWEPDSILSVSFNLPGRLESVKAKVKVARLEETFDIFGENVDVHGMGLKFIDISDEDFNFLKKVIGDFQNTK